ncbi:MAG: hypothetical protein ACYTFY_23560, partial [Planctomycetota bacterium]
KTGPAVADNERQLSEASINQYNDEWIISLRSSSMGAQTGWIKCTDPFGKLPSPVFCEVPSTYGPRLSLMCPDGILRIATGDINISPYKEKRNPLYLWNVDAENFNVSNKLTIYDSRESKIPLRNPMIDYPILFPYHNGKQVLAFRKTVPNNNYDSDRGPALSAEELEHSGSYYSEIEYSQTFENQWDF